jgi:hypothetical protein
MRPPMKGLGDFEGSARSPVEFEDLDEATRVGPIPLTVKRSSANTPVEFDLPVIASVDVDLRTPAPRPFPLAIAASNKPAPTSHRRPTGAVAMQPRPPSPQRPYIRPTPTFSFTDEPPPWAVAPQAPQRRGRSGSGLFAIGMLMAVAGVGGYMAVKYHAWQQLDPIVARAKELGQSFRTLAPSASPEPTRAATPVTAPAPAAPPLRPTVVPIEPARAEAPATASSARVADRPKRRQPAKRKPRAAPLSAEAAAEEALLSAPSRGR